MSVTLQNPLLPGFYPDPSICRVGDDFYMVTSSFSYYPGVPIFHSRDLAHWEQIGHVLDRPEQLLLDPYAISGGIFAPTIRYHEGLFYMITTNVNHGGNFIVTAERPEGPWSDPHWIAGAEGIDPSLFWDDDGRAYYTGTCGGGPGERQMIWLSEIDLVKFELVGEKTKIWGGAMENAAWPEAPHLYKVNGYYYLMIAEGGTEHFHSETIARAKQITGPYESYRGNPILTQRHLGMKAAIANTGHADLVELQDGSWYIVFLASRPYGGYHKNLGRETFIAPVVWEEGWPIVSPGTGRIEFTYEGPDLPAFAVKSIPEKDDFDGERLGYQWNFLGTPDTHTYRLEDGCLKLKLYDKSMGQGMVAKGADARAVRHEPQSTGFLGRRQQHMSFEARAKLCFTPQERQTAGMVVLQNDYQQLRVEVGLNGEGSQVARAVSGYTSKDASLLHKDMVGEYREELLGEILWEQTKTELVIRADGQDFTLAVAGEDGQEQILAGQIDGSFLGSETAGGFVGAYVGMFASGNGTAYDEYASFEWFSYCGRD